MADRRAPSFHALLSYQINSTADAVRRGGVMRLRRLHDVSLMEWRTLALIDHLQPVRLRDLATEAAADKAQVSRIVSALVARGLVQRQSPGRDTRSAHLALTSSGRAKLAGLLRSVEQFDRSVAVALQSAEAELLLSLLARVRTQALELMEDEERLQPGAQA